MIKKKTQEIDPNNNNNNKSIKVAFTYLLYNAYQKV